MFTNNPKHHRAEWQRFIKLFCFKLIQSRVRRTEQKTERFEIHKIQPGYFWGSDLLIRFRIKKLYWLILLTGNTGYHHTDVFLFRHLKSEEFSKSDGEKREFLTAVLTQTSLIHTDRAAESSPGQIESHNINPTLNQEESWRSRDLLTLLPL